MQLIPQNITPDTTPRHYKEWSCPLETLDLEMNIIFSAKAGPVKLTEEHFDTAIEFLQLCKVAYLRK